VGVGYVLSETVEHGFAPTPELRGAWSSYILPHRPEKKIDAEIRRRDAFANQAID
jgi:hypothetical protein